MLSFKSKTNLSYRIFSIVIMLISNVSKYVAKICIVWFEFRLISLYNWIWFDRIFFCNWILFCKKSWKYCHFQIIKLFTWWNLLCDDQKRCIVFAMNCLIWFIFCFWSSKIFTHNSKRVFVARISFWNFYFRTSIW